MFASIHLQFSSKPLFFMSFSPIVARRRGCQLAATVPVLLFTWATALCCELLLFTRAIALCCGFFETCQPHRHLRRPVNRQPGSRARDS